MGAAAFTCGPLSGPASTTPGARGPQHLKGLAQLVLSRISGQEGLGAKHAARRRTGLEQAAAAARVTPAWRPVVSAADRQDGSQSFAQGALPAQKEFKPGMLLGGKYEVVDLLGRGANGVTYLCRNSATCGDVAVKCLSLRSLKDWKQLELFEREAQILKSLDHRGIPRYLEYFELDTEQDRAFFLVQEVAQGRSLAEMVASGWRADEAEMTRIGVELLNTLEYLGSRRPPVTHRDVKPENIVIEGGKTGGRVFLVDFGGVQAAAAAGDNLGSTIVGTYGYMAPEQFRGAATPVSDLYGLGGTLLYLLSGRPPSAFPVDRMRTDFSSVKMSARLEAVVDGLLEPLPEDRMPAEDALALLTGKPRPARSGRENTYSLALPDAYPSPDASYARRRPAGSKIVVKKRGPRLEIDIPPAGFSGNSVATGAFAIAWNSFVAFWTISAVAGGGLLFGLFSLPFWAAGYQLAKQAFGHQFIRERLVINLNSWKIEQQMAFARAGKAEWNEEEGQGKEVTGRAADLEGASIEVPMVLNGQPQYQLVLREGLNRYAFGEGLNPLEQEWMVEVINEHVAENQGRMRELGGFVEGSRAALPEAIGQSADFASSAQQEVVHAEATAHTVGVQARQAAAQAAAVARKASERAAADMQRSAGRFSGSRFSKQQQQREERQWADNEDDDDLFGTFR